MSAENTMEAASDLLAIQGTVKASGSKQLNAFVMGASFASPLSGYRSGESLADVLQEGTQSGV